LMRDVAPDGVAASRIMTAARHAAFNVLVIILPND